MFAVLRLFWYYASKSYEIEPVSQSSAAATHFLRLGGKFWSTCVCWHPHRGETRSLAHPKWRTSEAMSKQGSVRAVAVWVGLLKWGYYFVMILGTIEQKETLKILTNIIMSSVRKMARDGLTNILGWVNFVCAPGLDRLTRLGMD